MITVNQLKAVLNRAGATFAGIDYVTQVKTAAAHKEVNIEKHVTASVQLFQRILDAKNVYEAAVKRSAEKLGQDASDFTAQSNYYEHDEDAYSVVYHRNSGKAYLYAFFKGAESYYTIDGRVAEKEEVAQYLTPASRKSLLEPSSTTTNVTHGIEHDIKVRTISLENIINLRVNRQALA